MEEKRNEVMVESNKKKVIWTLWRGKVGAKIQSGLQVQLQRLSSPKDKKSDQLIL